LAIADFRLALTLRHLIEQHSGEVIGNRQSAIGNGLYFPGSGFAASGHGTGLSGKFPAARQVFEEADEALGFSLSELCFNGRRNNCS
jgi:hypothetical protein